MNPMRSGSPPPLSVISPPIAIASESNVVALLLMSKYCAVENQSSAMPSPGDRFQRIASRYGLTPPFAKTTEAMKNNN